MTTPSASIVVCTRNRASSLEEALTDLVGQQLSDERAAFEVVVVDDGSTDATREVVAGVADRSAVDVRRVSGDGRGVAHARNVGVRAAVGDWIAFFDDDQRTGPAWLSELLDVAEGTATDMVGGPIEVSLPEGAEVGPVVRAIYGEHPTERQRRRGITPLPGGGNRLVHRRVFDLIGLHDESMPTGEDLDLVTRAEGANVRFGWAQSAAIWHLIPSDRLAPAAVRHYSRRAGTARARVDFKRLGRWRLAGSATMIGVKACVNAVLIAVASLRGRKADVLDCRARGALFGGYLVCALRLMVRGTPA